MARNIDILVAAGDQESAEVILDALHRTAPSANVICLTGGNAALQYLFTVGAFKQRPRGMPGIVLLDMGMPVISGLCVLDVIRAHPRTSNIPVLMLNSTGHPQIHVRAAGFEPTAYVGKSPDRETCCMLIQAALDRWLAWGSVDLSPSQLYH